MAWAIDAKSGRIHTHENPVSIFPPVIVAARTVYPGLDYLQSLLDAMPAPAPLERKSFEEFTHREIPAPPPPLRKKPFEEFVHAGQQAENAADVRDERPSPAPADRTHHILFLAANPRLTQLDLEREFARIETILEMARERRATIKPVWAATFARLSQAMLRNPATIVHFSGHGERDGIVLRDDAEGEVRVSGKALARLVALFRPVQCVVLNACYSETQADEIRKHVDYVVGMRDQVPDTTGIAFSTGFYQGIAAGEEIPRAFELGMAHAEASPEGYADLIVLL